MSGQQSRRLQIYRWLRRSASLAVMFALSAPAVASATGNAARSEYTRQAVDPSSTLPFTGYAILGVVVIAMVMLSVGALLRHVRTQD